MRFNTLPVSDSFFLRAAVFALFVSGVWMFIALSNNAQVAVPASGGSFSEGIVGTPRFVNPVLAVTRTDKDVSALIFDGIMKLGSNGVPVPNVAESVTISEDGLTYNVILKSNVLFHDGTPLTAADIVFTVGRIQEPSLASPLRTNFDGVVVEEIGEHELNFILPEPYSLFPENLTFGILPYHIWKDATNEEFPFSQRNSEPIGTGPYKIGRIERSASGIPESYTLERNTTYHANIPKIERIVLKFFTNEEKLVAAFNKGLIDSAVALDQSSIAQLSIDPETHTIIRMPLPRTFALFLNQNKSPAFRDPAVRKALDLVIDRNALIEATLGGYGKPLNSPIPPGFGIENTESVSTSTESLQDRARAILKSAGWKLSAETGIWEKEIDKTVVPLAFSIATGNTPVFERTAEFLQAEWETLGVSVTIKQFEQSDLTQAIIRPRDYEALLFGTALGRSLDLYSFWHSSQRNDPGLNIALYANLVTDAALEKTRTTQNTALRMESLAIFAEEIKKEVPAIFLYSPELLYVFPNRIIGETFTGLAEPHERFSSVTQWFINTESVWPFFNTEEELKEQ